MKKVLMVYNYFGRYSQAELKEAVNLLKKRLDEVGFHDYSIETANEVTDGFDMIAGYKLGTNLELSLSQKYGGNYLHFFGSHHMFDFASVCKNEETAGYTMYTISPIQPPAVVH